MVVDRPHATARGLWVVVGGVLVVAFISGNKNSTPTQTY